MSGERQPELRTERLLLRRWREADREPFAVLNADATVMATIGRLLTREESDGFIERIEAGFEEHGFGLWAVEAVGVAPLIGFVGLSVPRFEAHFTPCVEVGWRLAHAFWDHGYATEGALAALGYGFEVVGLDEIVSFTAVINHRSQRVMERLGMISDPADAFDHPNVAEGDPLRPHVLYRMSAEAWREDR